MRINDQMSPPGEREQFVGTREELSALPRQDLQSPPVQLSKLMRQAVLV